MVEAGGASRDDVRAELRGRLRVAGLPDDDEFIRGKVFAILSKGDGTTQVYATTNIVTDAGDQYYAERAANQTPAQFVDTAGTFTGVMGLATAATVGKDSDYADITSPVSGSEQSIDATYPKTNDDDTDNPGTVDVDVVTYRRSYTTAQANASNISHVYLTVASPVTASPLLSVAAFASAFTKTSNDTLKVFVNHTFTGS